MTGIKTASLKKKSEYIVRKMSYNNKQLWFSGEIDSSEEKEITFFFSSSRKKRITKDLKRSFFRILQWIVQYRVIVWMATLTREK